MSSDQITKYIEHLANIGRKYFTRPEDEPPTTEMTFFEKCILTGYLIQEDGTLAIVAGANSDLVEFLAKILINNQMEDERALIDLLKQQAINFYKKKIEMILELKTKEVEDARHQLKD